jgi:hypothetical protein
VRFQTPTLDDYELHYILGCDAAKYRIFRRFGGTYGFRMSKSVNGSLDRVCESENQQSLPSRRGVTSSSQTPPLVEEEFPFQNK